jgi:hypothetical protein
MKRIHTMIVPGVAACVLAVPAFAQETSKSVSVWHSNTQDGDALEESHQIEVRVEDGDITVVIDGEEVPADRIEKDGRRIVVLDENGDEIRSFGMGHGDMDFRFGFGGEGPMFRQWRDADGLFAPGDNQPFTFFGDAGQPAPVMLGVTMSEPGAALRYHLDLDEGEATLITGVYEGLPADDAGLREHDIIVSVDGDEAGPGAIRERLQDMEDGDRLRLTVISRGERRNVAVRVSEYDLEAMREAEFHGSGRAAPFGMGYRVLPGGDVKGFGDFFVAPNAELYRAPGNVQFDSEELKKRIEDAMKDREHNMRFGPREGGDERLGDIDDRMAELEKMLDRLLERLDDDS